MKGEQFKGMAEGYARTQIEPINPSPELKKSSSYGYLLNLRGKPHPWLCHCAPRHDWLIRTLVQNGVNVRHFSARSKEVPPKKCKEIAAALRKIERRGDFQFDSLLEEEIAFWSHCGGAKIHDWKSVSEMGFF